MALEKKIVLFILSDPMIYPPTVNAANILAEKGWKVYLIGIRSKTWEKILIHENVTLLYFGLVHTGIVNVLQFLWIHVKLYLFLIKSKINFCIAYDAGAVSPVAIASQVKGIRWGYHNHDLFENPQGWYKIIKFLELKLTRKATFISFPQEDRAEKFKKESALKQDIKIVYNAPKENYRKKNYNIILNQTQQIEDFKLNVQNILIYQGGLSDHFNLNILLDAIHLCKSSIGICLLGKELQKGIKKEFQKIIDEKKLNSKVLFLEGIPYDYLPIVTKKCNIGLAKFTFSKTAPINDYYLAGASNKISEYLACGLPVLAPDTPVNKAFFNTYPIGLLCNPTIASDIADKIDKLLTDTNLYSQISENNIQLFDSIFNYDKQFEKILKILD